MHLLKILKNYQFQMISVVCTAREATSQNRTVLDVINRTAATGCEDFSLITMRGSSLAICTFVTQE